jgi:hypothetical protein
MKEYYFLFNGALLVIQIIWRRIKGLWVNDELQIM